MNSYIVILNLILPVNSYVGLIAYLQSAIGWARATDNVWVVKTYKSASEIRDGVRDRIKSTDKVLIIKADKSAWASYGISKEITDWMKVNI